MSQIDFTYDIGYMGVVKLDSKKIIATGGNVSVEQSPIYTTGVWGAGWYNAAQNVAYAPNFVTTSGSVNFQLTKGDVFTSINEFAFQKRNLGKKIQIYPNGIAGYSGIGWCQSCSFSASQDAIVTGDFGYKTGNVENAISTDYITSDEDPRAKSGDTSKPLSELVPGYLDVYPFWASGVLLGMGGQNPQRGAEIVVTLRDDIIDWNASYSSQLVLVATCANYSSLEASKQAKYCALGTMTANGSFTIFRISSDLNPDQIRQCRACTIDMGAASSPSDKAKIKFGAIVFSDGSTDVQTGSSFIQSSFNFTALGNGTDPVMKVQQESQNNI